MQINKVELEIDGHEIAIERGVPGEVHLTIAGSGTRQDVHAVVEIDTETKRNSMVKRILVTVGATMDAHDRGRLATTIAQVGL